MHQSFEFTRDQHLGFVHIPSEEHTSFSTPSDERAAHMMVQKLRQGRVKLVGDVFIDTPSYKVSHNKP